MSEGTLVLLEDPQPSPVCPVLRLDLKIKVGVEHLWNDTDRRKPRYWERNMFHYQTEIILNIALMFSSYRTVNTVRLHFKDFHLTLFHELVAACCENHSKHIIQSLI